MLNQLYTLCTQTREESQLYQVHCVYIDEREKSTVSTALCGRENDEAGVVWGENQVQEKRRLGLCGVRTRWKRYHTRVVCGMHEVEECFSSVCVVRRVWYARGGRVCGESDEVHGMHECVVQTSVVRTRWYALSASSHHTLEC